MTKPNNKSSKVNKDVTEKVTPTTINEVINTNVVKVTKQTKKSETVTDVKPKKTKKSETVVKPESVDVKPESVVVKPESVVVKPESVVVKPESVDVKSESVVVKPESVDVKPESVVKPRKTNKLVLNENSELVLNIKPDVTNVKPDVTNVKPRKTNKLVLNENSELVLNIKPNVKSESVDVKPRKTNKLVLNDNSELVLNIKPNVKSESVEDKSEVTNIKPKKSKNNGVTTVALVPDKNSRDPDREKRIRERERVKKELTMELEECKRAKEQLNNPELVEKAFAKITDVNTFCRKKSYTTNPFIFELLVKIYLLNAGYINICHMVLNPKYDDMSGVNMLLYYIQRMPFLCNILQNDAGIIHFLVYNEKYDYDLTNINFNESFFKSVSPFYKGFRTDLNKYTQEISIMVVNNYTEATIYSYCTDTYIIPEEVYKVYGEVKKILEGMDPDAPYITKLCVR